MATSSSAGSPAKTSMRRTWFGYAALIPFALVVIAYEFLPLEQILIDRLIGKESGAPGLEHFIKIFTTPLYQQSI